MSFTVTDFEDLLKIIEAKPEWRSRLQRALFPEIDIPKAFQTLAASQAEMSSLLKRMDARIERLEIGQGQIKQDVTVLKQDVTVLKQDVTVLKQDVGVLKQDVGVLKQDVGVLKQDVTVLKQDVTVLKQDVGVLKQDVGVLKQDVGVLKQDVGVLKQDVAVLKQDVGVLKQDVGVLKQDVTVLKQDVTVLKQDVGVLKQDVGVLKQDVGVLKRDVGVLKRDSANLKGKAQEQTYHNKADAIFGRYLRNGRKAGSWVADHLYAALLDEKVSEAEVEQVLAADLLWIGEERQTKTQLVLVMEASWLAEANDVERALKRAAVLERIGLHALPVVGGEEWTQDATTLARTHHVVVTMNGYIDKDSWQAAWSKRTQ